MRFHVLGLPHTQVNKDYPNNVCAYTQKVVKFVEMMKDLGHEVLLYAGEQTMPGDAPADEHVVCITLDDQARFFPDPYPERVPEFLASHPGFAVFNAAAAVAIKDRTRDDDDIIITFGGTAQLPVSQRNERLRTVEAGIGYTGTFSDYRVFESYSWMHTILGLQSSGDVPDGTPYDTVIPNFFDPADFPLGRHDGDYVLFIGRTVERKGIRLAIEAAQQAGQTLLIAGGQGNVDVSTHPGYLGMVGPERRAELMGGASAVLVPTVYTEPFGGVAVEAQLCGTPVITTDWGAFTETVDQGQSGWRVRTMGEFVWCLRNIHEVSRGAPAIRAAARARYGMDTIKHSYQDYFERVLVESEERRPGK